MRSLLPCVATCGNLMAGFLALLLVAQADFARAAVLVAVAAGFDILDGAIARRASEGEGEKNDFGSNLDSLADLVSFGVVPAFALYSAVLYTLPFAGQAVCLVFFVCGALRLARFPLVRRQDYFVGLPIPPAGLLLVILAALNPPPPLALTAAVVMAGLMVSTLPFPSPSALRRLKKHPSHKHS